MIDLYVSLPFLTQLSNVCNQCGSVGGFLIDAAVTTMAALAFVRIRYESGGQAECAQPYMHSMDIDLQALEAACRVCSAPLTECLRAARNAQLTGCLRAVCLVRR